MYNANVRIGRNGKDHIKVLLVEARELEDIPKVMLTKSVYPVMVEVSSLHWGNKGNSVRARAFRLNEELSRTDGTVHHLLSTTVVVERLDNSNLSYTQAPINAVTGVFGPNDPRADMMVHPKLEGGVFEMQWFPRAANTVVNY